MTLHEAAEMALDAIETHGGILPFAVYRNVKGALRDALGGEPLTATTEACPMCEGRPAPREPLTAPVSETKAKPTGTRAVVVVDRGWIFAGDVTRENGRIKLSRALHVFRWESIGFAAMVETANADLRPIADVDIPEGAEIFCVPVPDGWGL